MIPPHPIHAADETVQACGHRLRVRRLVSEGGRRGPVLVFLHEALGSIPQWRDFPERLAGALGWPALVYERPGHGGSGPRTSPTDGTHFGREALEVLPRVLEACGVDRPLLVGHSDGGTMALLFAARHPERTAAVLTLAAHVFVEETTLAGIRRAEAAFEAGPLRRGLERHHGAQTEALFRGWSGLWLSEAHRAWNIEAEIRAAGVPALALQGEDDEYGTPAQVEAIAAATGGRGLILPGCGHAPHLQAPEAVLEAALPFLRGLPP